MGGVDVGESKGRSVNHDINMIPFIDLLMVTIAFLLLTAVWVTFSRMSADAQVPGQGGDITNEEKALHLFVNDHDFTLTWRHGTTVLSETRVRRHSVSSDSPSYPDLAKQLQQQWTNHGNHQDPTDRRLDRCVLHTPNDLRFKEIVGIMDAVYGAKRQMIYPGGERKAVAAFNMAFAAR